MPRAAWDAARAAFDAECPPLLVSELQGVLRDEPLNMLQFSSDLRRKVNGKVLRIMSYFSPALSSSIEFRGLIRQTLGFLGLPLGTSEQASRLREIILRQANKDRTARLELQHRLTNAVEVEAARRRSMQLGLPPAAAQGELADVSSVVASCKEAAAEATRAEMASLRAAIADLGGDRETNDEFRQEMRSAIAGLRRESEAATAAGERARAARELARQNEELREELLDMQERCAQVARCRDAALQAAAAAGGGTRGISRPGPRSCPDKGELFREAVQRYGASRPPRRTSPLEAAKELARDSLADHSLNTL